MLRILPMQSQFCVHDLRPINFCANNQFSHLSIIYRRRRSGSMRSRSMIRSRQRASQRDLSPRSLLVCPTSRSAASSAWPSHGLPSAPPGTSAGGRHRPFLVSSTMTSSFVICLERVRLRSTPLSLSLVRVARTLCWMRSVVAFSYVYAVCEADADPFMWCATMRLRSGLCFLPYDIRVKSSTPN